MPAFVPLYQSVRDHRKTIKLAAALGLKQPEYAVAHLGCFWLWSLDNSTDGTLRDVDDVVIAYAGAWRGKPEVFVRAMVHAGFLERRGDGSLRIHAWDEHEGLLIDRREQDKLRKRKEREAARQIRLDDAQVPSDVNGTSNGQNGTSGGGPTDILRTVHNTTGHNTGLQDTGLQDTSPHADMPESRPSSPPTELGSVNAPVGEVPDDNNHAREPESVW